MINILSNWEQFVFFKVFSLSLDLCLRVKAFKNENTEFFSLGSSRKERNLSSLTKLAVTMSPKAAPEPHTGMFSLSVDQPLNTPLTG